MTKREKMVEKVSVSISLPTNYVEALDNFADTVGLNRSLVVQRSLIALWQDVDQVESLIEMFGADPDKVRAVLQKLPIKNLEDEDPPKRYLQKHSRKGQIEKEKSDGLTTA